MDWDTLGNRAHVCYLHAVIPSSPQFASQVIYLETKITAYGFHITCSSDPWLCFFLNQSVRLFEWSRFQIWHFVCGSERKSSNNYFPHYLGEVEDVVVCHSVLAVTGIGKDRGVWVCKLHEQVHPRCFVFTETDKPSADMFPWCDSPSFVVHFWLQPRKESLYNNCVLSFIMFHLSFPCLICHALRQSTSLTTEGLFSFFCLLKENFVRHMQYAHEKLLVLNFQLKKKEP